MQSPEKKGYRYVVSKEEIRRFRALTPKEKLEWLEEVNDFVDKFLPEQSRSLREKLRRGLL